MISDVLRYVVCYVGGMLGRPGIQLGDSLAVAQKICAELPACAGVTRDKDLHTTTNK